MSETHLAVLVAVGPELARRAQPLLHLEREAVLARARDVEGRVARAARASRRRLARDRVREGASGRMGSAVDVLDACADALFAEVADLHMDEKLDQEMHA